MNTPPLFTGGYEDLIRLIMRLEERKLGYHHNVLPDKPAWKRLCLEFPLNLLAMLFANFLKALPPRVAERFFLLMFDMLSGYKYQSVGIDILKSSDNASKIYEFIKFTYSEPSLFTITSHPPVQGEIRALNLGMMGAGYRLMRQVHGVGRRFRIFLAVDVMALDTLRVHEEAIYAGAMAAYHVPTDRLPSSRNFLQKLLFRRYAYDSAAWRLFAALRSRHNIVMTQAGGVEATTRLIYTTRELVWRLRRNTTKKPSNILEDLRKSDKVFLEFLTHYSEGGNAWKRIESYLIARFARDPLLEYDPREASIPCDTGDLEESDRAAIFRVFAAFGEDPLSFNGLFSEFAAEFKRITPHRARLFRLLLRKVVRSGVPILVLPLDFSLDPGAPILQREPLALVPGIDGSVDAWTLRDWPPTKSAAIDESFFVSWGLKTFSA